MDTIQDNIDPNWIKYYPKSLREVMLACPDQQLRSHLVALKKEFHRARMRVLIVNPNPEKKTKKSKKEAIQVELF